MSSDKRCADDHADKMSWSLRLKKWKLLWGYHWKNFVRRLNLAYILFIFSLFLFSAIMVPNAFHRLPLPSEKWPFVFQLHGSIYSLANASDPNSLMPASNARIEIGGYQTVSDLEGGFILRFVSSSQDNIPLIISWRNETDIQRISFNEGQFERFQSFILG